MRYYSKRAASPNGVTEDTSRCVAEVYQRNLWRPVQCQRLRKFGPGGLYCKQHADMLKAGRTVFVPEDVENSEYECKD